MSMNIHEQAAVKRIINNWKLTPATFAQKVSRGVWIPSPWLQYAASRVAYGIARGGARIIISAPPRHGKTELISVNTSAWVLENYPKRNVILTGYGSDLVTQYGRRVRNMFWENRDLLKTNVPRESSQVDAFLTDNGGYMFSVGLGGAITGRGAHVLLIDDYIKEIKEALSPTHRDYVWNWFVTTAMTRLEPGASVIIIATRWHSDDLIGRILKNFPGQWENICFPAIAKEDDFIGRKTGEALFPERYGEEYLQSQKELLGSAFFAALYQQTPVDEDHKMSNGEWIKVTSSLPALDFKWVRVWDLAATDGAGDYTCGTLVGYSKMTGICVIADVKRDQMSPGKVEKTVRDTAMEDGLDVEICIEQEPGASGKSLVVNYETVVLPEFKVSPVPTSGKAKIIRAQPFLAAAEAGKVYLLCPTYDGRADTLPEWAVKFIHEFDGFGNQSALNDDQTDTAAAGYNKLSGRKTLSTSWGRAPRRNQDKQSSLKIRRRSAELGARASVGKLTFGRR
jgi:predicted phage terminase large subunit-like protein